MIKKYRIQKLDQFSIGVIWLIGVYFFVESNFIQIGMLVFILIIGIMYNAKLLVNIKKNDGFLIFETYSIITQKEEIKILESQLTEIRYNSNLFLNSHNLILKYEGTNGLITKKLYVNAEPWSELTSGLRLIKEIL